MAALVDTLWKKLAILEAAVPESIRNDQNFTGLRVDESGHFVFIGKKDFESEIIENDTGVDKDLSKSPAFIRAMRDAAVELSHRIDPTNQDKFSACRAGDGIYAVEQGIDDPDAARRNFGTIGWFFFLDGVPMGISCRHVLCQRGDATVEADTSVFFRSQNGAAADARIGRVWKFDRIAAVERNIDDTALVLIDDTSQVRGEFGLLLDGTRREYPLGLASSDALGEKDFYYIVGAKARASTLVKFRGVGSRRGDDQRMLFEQIFFDSSTIGGDSGAVVVHSQTRTVVGVCALKGKFTVASPVYLKGWTAHGMLTQGELTLPDLRSPA